MACRVDPWALACGVLLTALLYITTASPTWVFAAIEMSYILHPTIRGTVDLDTNHPRTGGRIFSCCETSLNQPLKGVVAAEIYRRHSGLETNLPSPDLKFSAGSRPRAHESSSLNCYKAGTLSGKNLRSDDGVRTVIEPALLRGRSFRGKCGSPKTLAPGGRWIFASAKSSLCRRYHTHPMRIQLDERFIMSLSGYFQEVNLTPSISIALESGFAQSSTYPDHLTATDTEIAARQIRQYTGRAGNLAVTSLQCSDMAS